MKIFFNQKKSLKLFFSQFYVFTFILFLNFLLPVFSLQNNIVSAAGLQNLHEEIQSDAITSEAKIIQNSSSAALSSALENKKYVMALLSDIHITDDTYDAKEKVVKMLNDWDSLDSLAILGDLSYEVGNEKDCKLASKLFKNFKGQKYFITGNHDYLYEDNKDKNGKKIRATKATRLLKLDRFKKTFDQKSLYFSKKVKNYLFIFLSVDAMETKYITTLSGTQLKWLKGVLSDNQNMPAVIFCHAPLYGTFSKVHDNMNMNNSAIQPADKIKEIIKDNPQVFMWVSGHMHIKATADDYNAPVNVYEDQVTCIHNSNMSKSKNWVNTLTLNSNYIIVKTYDCKKKKWLKNLERKVKVPKQFMTKKTEAEEAEESANDKTSEVEVTPSANSTEKTDGEVTQGTNTESEEITQNADDSIASETGEVQSNGRITDNNNALDEIKKIIEKVESLTESIIKKILSFFK